MKLLNGRELAGFIKERQAKQVRSLKQSKNIHPKLVILKTKDEPVINTYVRLKKRYGADIGVEVDIIDIPQGDAIKRINQLNDDDSVHGIIVQLPLEDPSKRDQVLNAVSLLKDVDGLAEGTNFDPATPTAIMWLLAGYNIDLRGKKFAVIGKGPLVGSPLIRMLEASEYEVLVADEETEDISAVTKQADIIITATGEPGLITSDMVSSGAVVVDAGVAVQSGKTVGDASPELYERNDILAITPQKGGVGPLTVCALFENTLKAAGATIEE